jgi:hypothetical protein
MDGPLLLLAAHDDLITEYRRCRLALFAPWSCSSRFSSEFSLFSLCRAKYVYQDYHWYFSSIRFSISFGYELSQFRLFGYELSQVHMSGMNARLYAFAWQSEIWAQAQDAMHKQRLDRPLSAFHGSGRPFLSADTVNDSDRLSRCSWVILSSPTPALGRALEWRTAFAEQLLVVASMQHWNLFTCISQPRGQSKKVSTEQRFPFSRAITFTLSI